MDKIQRIYEHLKRHNYTGHPDIYEWSDNEIVVCISWGDWKHDHLCVRYLLRLMGYEQSEKPTVTESNGSDCYSAECLYRECPSYRYVSVGTYEGELRDIAKALRAGDLSIVERAAELLSPLVCNAGCIVPMPSCDGEPNAIHELCKAIRERTGLPVVEAIRTKTTRPSMCAAKNAQKAGTIERIPYPEELMMCKGDNISHPAVIIDNVIATGTTAMAALNAIDDENSFVLALADDVNCKKITIFNATN